MRHHPAIEDAVQQQSRFQRQLQRLRRLAHDPAQRLRPERDAFGIERGRAGDHAEALAEQVQRQAGA